jgi:hypothetical protein
MVQSLSFALDFTSILKSKIAHCLFIVDAQYTYLFSEWWWKIPNLNKDWFSIFPGWNNLGNFMKLLPRGAIFQSPNA